MIPVGRVIVLRTAQKSELIEAIAMITWPALIAPVIGPALGGFITTYFSWRWNFFINIPLGLAGLAAILLVIPPTDERNHRPMDWLGFFLSSLSLGSFLYGLETFIHPGANALFSSTLIAIGLVAGASASGICAGPRRRCSTWGRSGRRRFAISNLQAGSYARLAISATPFLLPLMFQIGFGLDALQAGSLTIAYFVGNLGHEDADDADPAQVRLPHRDVRQRAC